MSSDVKVFNQYDAELAALESLDRVYYVQKRRTTADRVAYAQRQEVRESIRARLYTELGTTQVEKSAAPVVFSIGVAEQEVGHRSTSMTSCELAHDLRNYMGVALWRCEALSEDVQGEPGAAKDAAALLEVVRKVVSRLHQSCPLEAPQRPNLSAACV